MDDAELIAAVAGGDDAALRELFGRHGNLAVLSWRFIATRRFIASWP